MRILIYFLLTYFAIHNCSSCNIDFNRSIEEKPENLNYSEGDIISCKMSQTVLCFRMSNCLSSESSHIFLASSNSTVIHSRRISANQSIIVEESFLEGTKGRAELCSVITDSYFAQVQESCHRRRFYTSKGVQNAIRRARNSIETFRGRKTYFDPQRCNSEHWVASWRYNIAWARPIEPIASGFTEHASEICEAPGNKECSFCGVTDW